MPVPNTIADLNQAAASNYPLGTDTVGPNLDDYLRAGFAFTRQMFDGTAWLLGTVAGTDTITASCPVPFTAYVAGMKFRFLAVGANTTAAVTLNINGIGAKSVTKRGAVALTPNDFQSTMICEVVYDGTQFQVTSAGFASAGPGNSQLSGRNRLINASGRINQRVYVSGTATTSANQYTLDRWRVVTLGQNLGFAASGTVMVMTAPAGGVEQVIEASNIEGGNYFLSWSGTATATVNGTPVANGAFIAVAANTQTTVRFIGGTFSKPMFELGGVTPFEFKKDADELRDCYRYFWYSGSLQAAPILNAQGFSASAAGGVFQLPVPMRIAPTGALAAFSRLYASSAGGGPLLIGGASVSSVVNNQYIYISFTAIAASISASASTIISIGAAGDPGGMSFTAEL